MLSRARWRASRRASTDPADMLAQRRLASIASNQAGRVIGMIVAYLWVRQMGGQEPYTNFFVAPESAINAVIALTMTGAVAALGALRYRRSPRYGLLAGICVVTDVLVFVVSYALMETDPGMSAWVVLIVPLFVVSVNHGFSATVAVAVGECLAILVVTRYSEDLVGRPGSMTDAMAGVGVILIVGVILGARSRAFDRQLAELAEARRAMQRQALTDPLTGLGNRGLLADIRERLATSGETVAVLALDLNGFKAINDGLGHAAGDHVIQVVAARLRSTVRATDTVIRPGGDEFLVIGSGMARGSAETLVERLRDRIAEPIASDYGELRVTASAGFAVGSGDLDQLLLAADHAMYRMKSVSRTPEPADATAAPVRAR